ncbi:NlpC/P60 family protein [Acrocarpospora sp. B8E8]|uniref:NlpC/P60 family protein n=1 Tax=Acrocarpospora sp. B8E8 TaxID=3153572 RepID=UPI00325F5351
MAEFQAGEVVVPVVPAADGFIKDLRKQVLGGAFNVGRDIGREIQRGIESSIKSAKVDVRADTTTALAQVTGLQRQIQQISGRRAEIQVSADASGAVALLDSVDTAASRLDGRRAEINVDADTAGALSRLGLADAELSRLDGRTARARVDVDVSGALLAIGAVTAALAAIPVAATAALGVGALGAAAAAAGVGFAGLAAVAVPSLGRISEANKAAEQATKAVGAAVESAAAAQIRAQIATLQQAGAADQMRAAQDRVKDALAGVASAQQRLRSAIAAASSAQAAAAERVSRAERSLVDAQRSALKAQEALNDARREATRDLEDLGSRLEGSQLDLRDATLDVKDAERDLAKARKGGNAEDIERAEIAYERAKLRVEDLTTQIERLKQEQAEADQKGVEGSDRVVAAKDAVQAANQRVLDQQAELSKAHADEAKAAEDAAQRIKDARKAAKDAQGRVGDAKQAIKALENQQKIADLQEKLRKQQAKDSAAQAAAASPAGKADKLFKDLSPAAQTAALAIRDFKDAYKEWQESLEPAVLPAMTGALKVVEKLFVPLKPLIEGSAKALAGLEDSAAKALGGKFWTDFFAQLSVAAPTAITGLGKSFGNVATGVAGIVKAFLPFTGEIVGGIETATSEFATFGKNLGKSEGFQKFISFVRENAPKVWELIKNVASAIGRLVEGVAPLGKVALAGLSGLASLIAKLDPALIQLIASVIGAVVIGVKAWAVAQVILNVALNNNPIGRIIMLVGLLVSAIVYLWQTNETFRNVITTAWKAIGTAVQFVWENVLKPIWDGMVWLWQNVLAPAATWLWQNVLKPAFDGIGAALKWVWENILQPAFLGWQLIMKNVVGPAVTWLWKNVVKPAFETIGAIVKFAWEKVIQPAIKGWELIIKTIIGPVVTWLWKNVVKPAWDGIGSAIKTVWDKILKPTFDFLYKMIFETIPDGFKKGVGLIESIWNKVKEVAKKPVEFIVNTVWNNGIVKVWNAAAKLLGLGELSPVKFAKGGIYPGYTPGRDVGLAAVSGGEAIMRPEWTKAVGEKYVTSANSAARRGGVGGVARFLGIAGDPGTPFAGGFAGGGIVDAALGILGSGVKAGAEKLLMPLLDRAVQAVGGSAWGKLLVGIPRAIVKGVIDLFGKKEGNGAQAVTFARQQIGDPYQWGATGPNAWDCSGLTQGAWKAAGVSIPRVSQDQMKFVKPVTTPLPGDLGFPNPGHVFMYSGNGKIIEAAHAGTPVREVAARSVQLMGRPPQLFDDGGYLMPGMNLAYNATGSPEPVLNKQQWADLASRTQGSDGGLTIEGDYITQAGQTPQQIVDALSWRKKARR